MRKRQEENQEQHELEILKAVAQAWHGLSSSYRPTNEFDAHRRNFKSIPSRFKLEAMTKASAMENSCGSSSNWDFGQSLWDSYEIVTVSKRLEIGLVLDQQFSYEPIRVGKRRKESKNSLRNLLKRISSKRFNETDPSHEAG